MPQLIVLPSKKESFLAYFHSLQNLKMAIYKTFRVSEKLKKAKKNVVIADFSKIEARLKALYVRFWGIPEGGLKALQIKGFRLSRQEYRTVPRFLLYAKSYRIIALAHFPYLSNLLWQIRQKLLGQAACPRADYHPIQMVICPLMILLPESLVYFFYLNYLTNLLLLVLVSIKII